MTEPAAAPPAPVLLVISDRPFVWVGFRSPVRTVYRWIGERASDEERADARNFTGDPAEPETYRWTAEAAELSAVVDLQDGTCAQGAIDALRKVRPGAGVLVITGEDDVSAAQIAISRKLQWTDALRGDLEGELRKLEATRRLADLRAFAEPEGDVHILVHPDADPDALASALGIRALLRRPPATTPIITLGAMTRSENRRMCELLRMRVTVVTHDEVQKLDRIVAVDGFPSFSHADDQPRLAVIDHHPHDDVAAAEFLDLRPDYGATATMLTEYLRLDDERRIDEPLATALLFGIKTDTDSLERGAIAADVEAYAFLQSHADLQLLRKLQRPSYGIETARLYGVALSNLKQEADVAIVFLGRVEEKDAHVLADIADFCLGLEEMTWAIAGAVIEDELILTIRHLGGESGAGDLAKRLADRADGNGGGHATMARVRLPLKNLWHDLAVDDVARGSEQLMANVCSELEPLRVSRRSSRQARPVKARS